MSWLLRYYTTLRMWSLNKAIDYADTVPPLLLLVVVFATMGWRRGDYAIYFIASQFFFNASATLLNELERVNLFVYSLNFSWSYFILSMYFVRLYASRTATALILGGVIVYQITSVSIMPSSVAAAAFDSLSFGAVSLLITFYCLFYYARQLSGQPKENILHNRNFWYINGIFTYYASNFFIFLTYNTLVSRQYANIELIWKIHNAVFLVMCIYFFIGIRCKTLPEK